MANRPEPVERIYAQARRGTPYNPGVPADIADWMVAQAAHETGDFTHKFFRVNNNAFGYSYYPGSNYQDGHGDIADNGKPIGSYPNVEASTMEMVDWLYRRYREGKFPELGSISSYTQYSQLLKQAGYFGAPLTVYQNGIRNFLAKYGSGAAAVGGVGLILVAAIAFLFRKQIF